MNFGDLARSGTAPSSATKAKSNGLVAAAIPHRPKTRNGDSDINDFNYDLRTNKASAQYERGDGEEQQGFRRRQEGDEYLRAMESFQAAVDTWSSKKDADAGQEAAKRPESRNRVSKDPKKASSNLHLSGLSAYTQNVPHIVLHAKKGAKSGSSGSPRARDARTSSNHINELRAAYGADFVAASSKPKAASAAKPLGALRYQEESIDAAVLRSSTANAPASSQQQDGVVSFVDRPYTTHGAGRPSAPVGASSSQPTEVPGPTIPARRLSKKVAAVPIPATGGISTPQRPVGRGGGGTDPPRQQPSVASHAEPQSPGVKSSASAAKINAVQPEGAPRRSGSSAPTLAEDCAAADRTTSQSPAQGLLLSGGQGARSGASRNAAAEEAALAGGPGGGRGAAGKQLHRAAAASPSGEEDWEAGAGRDREPPERAAPKVLPATRVVELVARSADAPERVLVGAAEKDDGAVAERPQSRKLYLGADKASPKAAAIKAPRSAGARYSNFSPTRGAPSNAFEDSSDHPAPGASRQGSLRKMSSFSGFQQTRPWLEEDHLPVRRPPSRQSSAFPVHLADVPGETPDKASAGARPQSGSKRRKEEPPLALGSASGSPPAALLGGGDVGDSHSTLSHRPPSRQKLAAQHLFEGLRSSPEQEEAEIEEELVPAAPQSRQGPSSRSGRSAASRGLFSNPRDDGFMDLDCADSQGGGHLPFAVTVNYGSPQPHHDVGADFTVVEQRPSTQQPAQLHRRMESGASSHYRSDSGASNSHHRRMDSAESDYLALTSVVSEMSITYLPADSEAPRGRGAPGGRPATHSWDFAEGAAEPLTVARHPARPKTVTSTAKSPLQQLPQPMGGGSGAKGANSGNHYASGGHTHRARSAVEAAGLSSPGLTAAAQARGSPPTAKLLREPAVHAHQRASQSSGKTRSAAPTGISSGWTAEHVHAAAPKGHAEGSLPRFSLLQSHSSSPATFSDLAAPGDADGDDDAMTIMTEDSGRSRGESPLSMHSFTLESSLGEDFLNLFAPAGR